MNAREILLRVDATYGLTVKVGDRVRQGERLSPNAPPGALSIAPVTGVVRSIRFDPDRHDFVIAIAEAQ